VTTEALAVLDNLSPAELTRLYRERIVRDKSYQLYPLGQDVASYLRAKRKRLSDASYRGYESSLDKFARHFTDLTVEDFEPPVGTERIEEYLDAQWGGSAPGTYNVNLSITSDFFKFHVKRTRRIHGNPCELIERARKVEPYRTTFSADQCRAIIVAQDGLADRLALRLLLHFGLRKGALQAVQFKHFDHQRRRLTIFTKGSKVRALPIPDRHFWLDLERLILDVEAEPHHYLLCRRAGRYQTRRPEKPMGVHGLHRWWYRCLEDAGIVEEGASSGERMHKARHTAGQRVLDATGNLKVVQKFLGHASIQTTGDIYTDWDDAALAASLADVFAEEDE
jgi:integrase